MQPDAGPIVQQTCPLAMTAADTGALAATKAQLCNVSGSMGALHWYRLAATMPGEAMDYLQVELYDQVGAFAGGAVHTGTFPIDTDPNRCGVCVRGLGDKGTAGAKEYFASGGTVNVTAVGGNGQPISATLSDITFVEVDTDRKPVSNGCTATLAGAQLDGTVVQVGGTGGSTGGSGGGGGGTCPATIGD